MHEPDAIPEHRKRRAKALAMATLAGATVVALALPSVAQADPEPSPSPAPPPPSGNIFLEPPPGAPAPPPADPNAPPPPGAPAPPPADPNAPPPPGAPAPPPADPNAPPPAAADPNAAPAPPAPEPGRVDNAAGGFSYVVPAGWKVADATQLSYGQALLTKATAEGSTQTQPGQPGAAGQPANDTSVLLGRLDMKLFAGAESDNGKAATRLASDMGEFFMPFPGTRVNQQNGPLTAGDMPGAFSAYDVKFTDTNKPTGQIWAGVVGNATPVAPGQPLAPRGQRNERWFVVWLGTANNPIDKGAATALAQSIRPWAPPPPPEPDPNAVAPPADPNAPPADPNAPPPPNNAPPADPNAPPPPNTAPVRPPVGVGVPVDPANAPGMMPAG